MKLTILHFLMWDSFSGLEKRVVALLGGRVMPRFFSSSEIQVFPGPITIVHSCCSTRCGFSYQVLPQVLRVVHNMFQSSVTRRKHKTYLVKNVCKSSVKENGYMYRNDFVGSRKMCWGERRDSGWPISNRWFGHPVLSKLLRLPDFIV